MQGQLPMQFPILQKREFDSMQYVQPGEMRPVSPGVFEISGVAAGRYELMLKSVGPQQAEADQVSEVNLVRDGQELGETQGEALGKLKVTVKMPEDEPLPRQYAVGLRDAKLRIVAFQPGNANGETTLEGVKPGKYGIVLGVTGKPYVVARVVSAAGTVAGNGVDVVAGGSGEVTAELVVGEARIEGVVEKNGKPVAGVMVALVPKDRGRMWICSGGIKVILMGRLRCRGVVPGTYTVVAVEDAWGFDWMKAGVLARYVLHGRGGGGREESGEVGGGGGGAGAVRGKRKSIAWDSRWQARRDDRREIHRKKRDGKHYLASRTPLGMTWSFFAAQCRTARGTVTGGLGHW